MLGALITQSSLARAEDSLLSSFLVKLGQLRGAVSPNAISSDGKTWGEMTFLERVKTYDWTTEMYVLISFFVFVAFYYFGRKTNEKKVYKFFDNIKPVLEENFAYVGASPRTTIVKDSDTRYTTYASGRLNVESLLARFRLIDRQNVMNYTMGLVVPSLASSDGKPDNIEITLTPSDARTIEPGIFGIANKEFLEDVQADNYFFDLAKPVDSDKLPSPTYMFMYEHSDQVDMLFTPELKNALSQIGADKVLKWLVFSDVPSTAPKKEEDISSHPKLVLALNFPRNAGEYEAARQILDAALGLVDALVEKPPYRGSTIKRIKASRDAEVAKIRKAEEKVKQEELEAKKAEERREAARRERNLSEKEQRKLQKKEQEKQARKQKQRMTRRP